MWERIARRSADRGQLATERTRRARPRRWAVGAGAALCLALAVPAFAEPSSPLSWHSLTQRAFKSLEVGDGVRVDRTVQSGGFAFQLLGAVSDDRRTDLLFQLKAGGALPAYDRMAFGQAELRSGLGDRIELSGTFMPTKDETLSGMLEAKVPLPDGKRGYELNVRDLIFYRDAESPIALNPVGASGQRTEVNAGGAASIVAIESIAREGGKYTVRYTMKPAANGQLDAANNPRLVLRANGLSLMPSQSSVIASPNGGDIERQDTYKLSDADLAKADFVFARLEESERRGGEWSFSFEADGQSAEQAVYRRTLDPAAVANDSGLKFKELAVTPLDIRLAYDGPRVSGRPWPIRAYERATLLLDGKEIEGAMFVTDDDGEQYIRFPSDEWYRDWSEVPMQLRLRSMVVYDKASPDQLLALDPKEDKKTIDAEVAGFPVRFVYYRDGDDLIVESQWRGEKGGSILQTSILADGSRIFAEPNLEPALEGSRTKVERYRNIPEGKLQLNPFLYYWRDADKSETITLR